MKLKRNVAKDFYKEETIRMYEAPMLQYQRGGAKGGEGDKKKN